MRISDTLADQIARLVAEVNTPMVNEMVRAAEKEAEKIAKMVDLAGLTKDWAFAKDISFAAQSARMLQEQREREAALLRIQFQPLPLDRPKPPRRSIVPPEVKRRIGF
jgi:hypothetical protein